MGPRPRPYPHPRHVLLLPPTAPCRARERVRHRICARNIHDRIPAPAVRAGDSAPDLPAPVRVPRGRARGATPRAARARRRGRVRGAWGGRPRAAAPERARALRGEREGGRHGHEDRLLGQEEEVLGPAPCATL